MQYRLQRVAIVMVLLLSAFAGTIVRPLPAAAACAPDDGGTMAYDSTVTGYVEWSASCYVQDYWTFAGSYRDVIDVTTVSDGNTVAARVTDENGNGVGGGQGSFQLRLPASGVYTLTVRNESDQYWSANYALTLTAEEFSCVDATWELTDDNSRANAQTRSLPLNESRGICVPGDEDWYALDLTAGNTYALALDQTSFTMFAQIWEGATTNVWSLDTNATATFRPERSGTYYLMLRAQMSDAFHQTSAHVVSFVETGVCPDLAIETAGDDGRADGRSVTIPLAETRGICLPDDRDWYTFEFTAGSTYTIDMGATTFSKEMELYAGENATPDWISRNGPLTLRPNVTGTYDLLVRSQFAHDAGTEAFAVTISETPCVDAAIEADGDDTRETARSATPRFTETGRGICTNNDQDWYVIDLVAGNDYTFAVGPSPFTTQLEMFEGAASSPGWSVRGSSLTVRPSTSGTYYFLARSYWDYEASSVGSYDLSISSSEPTVATPATTATGRNAVNAVIASGVWVRGTIRVTLAASDGVGTGIQSLTYRASGSHSIPETTVEGASGLITIFRAGSTTITFSATDWAGNVEAEQTFVVNIDKSLPTVAATAAPAANPDGWINAAPTVRFSATDTGGAGIRSITYSATGSQPIARRTIVGAKASFKITKPGSTTITYFTTDYAGNVSPSRTLVVKLDTAVPAASHALSSAPDANGWHKGPLTMTLSGVDGTSPASSGIASITYSATGANPRASTTVAGATIPLSLTATGETTVTWFATDNAGNRSLAQVVSVKIDGTRPSVTRPIITLPTSSTVDSAGRIRVLIRWLGNDAHSGLSRFALHLSSDAGTTWSPIPLSGALATGASRSLAPGTYQFRVRAFDNAGNVTANWLISKSVVLRLDDDTHASVAYAGVWTTDASASSASGGSTQWSNTAGDTVTYTLTGPATVAWITTRSANRGIATIFIDGSTTPLATIDLYAAGVRPRQLAWSFRFTTAGTHQVTIRVTGAKNAAATGRRVDIDGFVVLK